MPAHPPLAPCFRPMKPEDFERAREQLEAPAPPAPPARPPESAPQQGANFRWAVLIVATAAVAVGLFLASMAVSKQTECRRGGLYGGCTTTYWFNR